MIKYKGYKIPNIQELAEASIKPNTAVLPTFVYQLFGTTPGAYINTGISREEYAELMTIEDPIKKKAAIRSLNERLMEVVSNYISMLIWKEKSDNPASAFAKMIREKEESGEWLITRVYDDGTNTWSNDKYLLH